MSVLFATPCYGGQMMCEYADSMMQMQRAALEAGLKYDILWRWNESLIQRARNGMAAYFMDQTDFEYLMFIDADIEFAPDDVAKLWNMQQDIAVGIYPMKKKEEDWYACWKDGELVKDLERFNGEPTEVDFAGTGFMMIRRGVLEKFRETWPEREHWEGGVAGSANPREVKSFAWFDPRVADISKTDEPCRVYLSEDYAFCHDAQVLGFRVMCHPEVKLKHWGRYGYGSRVWA